MRRLIVLGVMLALAVPAAGHAQVTPKQFRTLKAQVAKLKTQNANQQRQINNLRNRMLVLEFIEFECSAFVVPVSRFTGYATSTGGVTTALDADASGSPQVWLQEIDAGCIESGRAEASRAAHMFKRVALPDTKRRQE